MPSCDALSEADTDLVLRFETSMRTNGRLLVDNSLHELREKVAHRDTPTAANFFPAVSMVALRFATSFVTFGHSLDLFSSILNQYFVDFKTPFAPPLFRDSEPTQHSRMGQVLVVTSSRPLGVSSPIGSDGVGVLEVVLHRNHALDDGRGLNEGLLDSTPATTELLIRLDIPDPGFAAWRGTSLRQRSPLVVTLAEIDSAAIAPVLSREGWTNNFHGYVSLLKAPLPPNLHLQTLQVRHFSKSFVRGSVALLPSP